MIWKLLEKAPKGPKDDKEIDVEVILPKNVSNKEGGDSRRKPSDYMLKEPWIRWGMLGSKHNVCTTSLEQEKVERSSGDAAVQRKISLITWNSAWIANET